VRGRGVDGDAGAVLPPLGHDPVFSGESTPFRGGNYDLLLSLATDLAATRALRPAEEPGDDDCAPPEKLAPRSAAFLRECPRRAVSDGATVTPPQSQWWVALCPQMSVLDARCRTARPLLLLSLSGGSRCAHS